MELASIFELTMMQVQGFEQWDRMGDGIWNPRATSLETVFTGKKRDGSLNPLPSLHSDLLRVAQGKRGESHSARLG